MARNDLVDVDDSFLPGDKPRLTEQEKKSNHIASEQKRRQAIREGFDEIADIVPGLQGQGRSEAIVLEGAAAYIRKLLAERHRLLDDLRRKGYDARPYELDSNSMDEAMKAAASEERAMGERQ